MAVLVLGAGASTLRLKIAYVAWDDEDIRTTIGALAGWREASPSKLIAQAGDDESVDDDVLYTLDLEPGITAPARLPTVTVRSFVHGAVSRDPDAPALIQALEVCDAVVLVARADQDGMAGAISAFSRSLVCLAENGGDLRGIPFVMQWSRDGVPAAAIAPLLEALAELHAKLVAPGLAGSLRRLFGGAPALALETVECGRGETAGVREALRAASRAALGSKRVDAYVARVTERR